MRLTLVLAKYSLAGLVNSLVGYAVIFGCMACGLGPTVSNVLGYCVGFVTSFVQSRHWVFRSKGGVLNDGLRFIPAFLAAFGVNLLVLQGILETGANPYLAQMGACAAFWGVGFVLNYIVVFRKRDE
jgi:putative flippase GtrA